MVTENMDNFIPKNAVEFCNDCKKLHYGTETISCDLYPNRIPWDVLVGDVVCESFEQKTELYDKMQKIIRCPKVTHEIISDFLKDYWTKREMLPWEHCAMKFQRMGVPMKREFLSNGIYRCNYGKNSYFFGIDLDEPEITDDMLQNGTWLVYTWAD